jgi:hypothetical protein
VSKVTVKDEAQVTIPTANLKRGMYVLHMYGDQLISKTIVVE